MVDVSTGNIGVLKGLSDVEFDFGVSATVKETFRAEATRVSGQRGSRFLWRSTGLTDFKGYFAEVFRQNGVTQLGDLDEVVTNLRLVATKVEELEQAAREENQRRQTAREWAQRQEDRNGVDKWIDDHWVGGSAGGDAVGLGAVGVGAAAGDAGSAEACAWRGRRRWRWRDVVGSPGEADELCDQHGCGGS